LELVPSIINHGRGVVMMLIRLTSDQLSTFAAGNDLYECVSGLALQEVRPVVNNVWAVSSDIAAIQSDRPHNASEEQMTVRIEISSGTSLVSIIL
jgi:hypothetical protein